MVRLPTKEIEIGSIKIGGSNPVAVQSMVKVDTRDVSAVIRQVRELEKAGCEIVRVAVKDKDSARAISQIKKKINIPLVADIHFSYNLALLSIRNGADKIRLNPGNIFKPDEVRAVAEAAGKAHIPIRVGVNSGSVRNIKYQKSNIKNVMVQSAINYIKMLERFGFYDIVVSLKASSVLETIQVYREFSKRSNYPLHLGITATGFPRSGMVKSSLGIGMLLSDGIGDTFRVSLTADPKQEVKVARAILEALELRCFGPEIISCPTCGRCEVDLVKIVRDLEKRLWTRPASGRGPDGLWTRPMKLAVMGCVVNGPGEAKGADLGIAFGRKEALFFKKGRPVRKISFDDCVNVLLRGIKDAGDVKR